MTELNTPDILGQYNQGFATGRGQLAGKLAGQAYSATGDQQKSLLGQLAGVNPQLAVSMGDNFNTQQRQQAADAKTQEVDHAKKLNGAVNYVLAAVKSGNQAQMDGAMQAVAPYMTELTGQPAPTKWDPSMLPALYKAQATTAGLVDQKLTVVGQGSTALGPDGHVAFANPAAPGTAQIADIPDGNGGTIKKQYDKNSGTWVPLNYGGGQPAPQRQPAAPQGGMQTSLTPVGSGAVDQANAFLSQGYPPEQAAALAMGAHPGTTLAVDHASGQFKDVSDGSAQIPQGQGAPQGMPPQGAPQMAPQGVPAKAPTHGMGYTPPKADKQLRTLTDAELKQYNLPPGALAQMDGNGKISVVNKPGQDSSTVTPPGDPSQTGDAYLQTLPASMRGVVKAIAHGDQAPPSASSRSPAAQALLQAVYTYDPTASASNLPTRTATRKSFTSGKDAQNMTALSQLALHLDHLNGQVDSISGMAAPDFVNGAINAVTDKSNGKTTAFDSSANAVAHELRAVFANAGGGTEAELEQNLKQLNSSNSLAQKQAAIQNIAQLVHGRFAILQDKYTQGMGKTEDPFQTSYPGAEATILRLAGATHDGQQAQPQQSAQPRAINPQTGHAIVWNGSAWVPE